MIDIQVTIPAAGTVSFANPNRTQGQRALPGMILPDTYTPIGVDRTLTTNTTIVFRNPAATEQTARFFLMYSVGPRALWWQGEIGGGGDASETLAQTYAAAAAPADNIMLVTAAKGPVVARANVAAVNVLLSIERADANPLLQVTNSVIAADSDTLVQGRFRVTSIPATTARQPFVHVIGGADTNQPAGTESTEVLINLDQVRTWDAGAMVLQRTCRILAEEIAFEGASVLDDAVTVSIGAAPSAGPNATITRAWAFMVENGNTSLADELHLHNTAFNGAKARIAIAVDKLGAPTSTYQTIAFEPTFFDGYAIEVRASAGRVETGGVDAGFGGNASLCAGDGGDSVNAGSGGRGGFVRVETGAGGDGGVAQAAGDGGLMGLIGGNGGAGTAAGAAGSGGSIIIEAGNAGADGGGGGGAGGNVSIAAGDATDAVFASGSVNISAGQGGIAAGSITIGVLGIGGQSIELGQVTSLLGHFGAPPVVQQTGPTVNITNNVTAGGVDGTINDIVAAAGEATAADLTTTRNAVYQCARAIKFASDAMRAYGTLT